MPVTFTDSICLNNYPEISKESRKKLTPSKWYQTALAYLHITVSLKRYTSHRVLRDLTEGQEDDYTSGYLLEYNYFKNYNKMIAIDLSKPQALDADAKAMKQINFVGNLNQVDNANDNTTTFFIAEEAKEVILDFSQGTMKVSSYFVLL